MVRIFDRESESYVIGTVVSLHGTFKIPLVRLFSEQL